MTAFDMLLRLVEVDLREQDTVMREAISPYLKLAGTLRYMCTLKVYVHWWMLFKP